MAVLTELKKQGAKRLHLNLSQEAQIEAQQRGMETFGVGWPGCSRPD